MPATDPSGEEEARDVRRTGVALPGWSAGPGGPRRRSAAKNAAAATARVQHLLAAMHLLLEHRCERPWKRGSSQPPEIRPQPVRLRCAHQERPAGQRQVADQQAINASDWDFCCVTRRPLGQSGNTEAPTELESINMAYGLARRFMRLIRYRSATIFCRGAGERPICKKGLPCPVSSIRFSSARCSSPTGF